MKKDPIVGYCSEDNLKRVAKIMGEMSSAAQALKRADEYRADGAEDIVFAHTKFGMLLVVPVYAGAGASFGDHDG